MSQPTTWMERRFSVRLQNTRRGSGGRPMALAEESAAGGGAGGERASMGGACCHCSKRGGKTPSQCACRGRHHRSVGSGRPHGVVVGIVCWRSALERCPDRERAAKSALAGRATLLAPGWCSVYG